MALQILRMLIHTYTEALGLNRTYRFNTVKEALMAEVQSAAPLEENGEALLSKLFRERFAKDKVQDVLK